MKNFFTHAALAALLSMAISIGAQAEEKIPAKHRKEN